MKENCSNCGSVQGPFKIFKGVKLCPLCIRSMTNTSFENKIIKKGE